MDAATRNLVRSRAGGRCEYCRLRQTALALVSLHIEHVIPRQHGGGGEDGNLAPACHHCNLHKGPNLSGIDPATGAIVVLFNPRRDSWDLHFRQEGSQIVGCTPTGRATVQVLAMNAPLRVRLREEAERLDP